MSTVRVTIYQVDKSTELAKLKKETDSDKSLPLRDTATQLVFGEGNPDADIYFLGEAPGFNEDKLGRPFIGRAGKLLETVMLENKLKREDVYISNVVRFRPPENRDPSPEEIAAFQPYVDKEIEIINPPVIVTLGRFSMNKFLPGVKISGVHGKPTLIEWNKRKIAVVPMYHPAAALRASAILNEFRKDFKIIPRVVTRAKAVREKEAEANKPKPAQLGLTDE